MFSLTKYAPRVYHLQFDHQFDLCATFMRYQEFYESANPRFVNSSFTLSEFELWYTKDSGKEQFTYHSDWAGFNMPLDIIKRVHDCGIPDPNMYDSFMWGIYKMIDTLEGDCYIVGSSKDVDIIDHELTHAMYYVNQDYKREVDDRISSICNSELLDELYNVLTDEGYAPHVFVDEINAYLTEYQMYQAFEDEELMNIPGFKALRQDLMKIRKRYFEKEKK